jgi:hypothetical protein
MDRRDRRRFGVLPDDHLKDGDVVRVGVTAVGPEKFWGVGLGEKAQTGARWTAYDAEGKPVGSGAVM